MSIQLQAWQGGNSSDNSNMMMDIVNRAQQLRMANQARWEEKEQRKEEAAERKAALDLSNARYEEAKALAAKHRVEDQAWNRTVHEDQVRDARSARSIQRMQVQAQQRANALQYERDQFEFNQIKTKEHAGEYTGRLLGLIDAPEYFLTDASGKQTKYFNTSTKALYGGAKGEYIFNDKLFATHPFTPDKKDLFWKEYSSSAIAQGVKPSRTLFEMMWSEASRAHQQKLWGTVKGWEAAIPVDKWQGIVGGANYDKFTNEVNSAAVKPEQLIPIGGVGDRKNEFADWGNYLNLGFAGLGSWYTGKDVWQHYRGAPRLAEMWDEAATGTGKAADKVKNFVSKAPGIGRFAGGETGDAAITKTIDEIYKLKGADRLAGIRSLSHRLPKSKLLEFGSRAMRSGKWKTGVAVLAAAGVAWAVQDFFDQE